MDITEQIRAERLLQVQALGLTRAELAVLPLFARRDLATYAAMGRTLHMSGETVRKHAQHIAGKLGLASVSREMIEAAAEEQGLAEVPFDTPTDR